MSSSRDRFLDLMKHDILKLDLADLDFGIYRILNHRRAEIEAFFDEELPAALDEAMTDEDEDETVFAESEEDHLYNALYTFFSRYYRDGDFQPQQRRANDARYSVPYNGEDVHFHWRSKGSHYIKTTEELKSYSFRSGGWKVRFELVEAFQEPDNVKGTSRHFVPVPDEARVEVGDEGNLFIVPFTFRKLTVDEDKRYGKKSGTIDGDSTQERLIADLGDEIDPPDGVTMTDLLRHMQRYARKNCTDYFVHPQLGEFLRAELGYYLKNEFLDIEALTSPDAIADRLIKMRAIRQVANRIIDMLHEIESFQARLFEKRKFVLSNSYLVPIRMVPEELRDDVLASEDQIDQWRRDFGMAGRVGRKTLATHPTLVVDTSLLGTDFQNALLESIDDVDGRTDGILINGENFGALRTVVPTFENRASTVYIDPPYNTGNDGFLYRDDFSQHSAWLSFMEERLRLGRPLLDSSGIWLASIDDSEQKRLGIVLDSVFGPLNRLGELVWDLGAGTQAGHFTRAHEYVLAYAKSKDDLRSFVDHSGGVIIERALKKISEKNPAGTIAFPAGMEFEGEDAVFSGEFGKSEKIRVIGEDMVFEHGRLVGPVTLEAGWAMRRQIESWLAGNTTYDTKGQRVIRFFFRKNGQLWYEKERGTRHPSTVLTGLASTKAGSGEVEATLGDGAFAFPKPTALVTFLVELNAFPSGLVVDFFAGSGTTGESVIKANRSTAPLQAFLLVEMGEFFDSILKRRIVKVMYAPEWQGGVPKSEPVFDGDTPDWVGRSPRLVQVIKLETYEDSLNSLVVGDDHLGSEHRIRYAIPDSVDESPVLMATDRLESPFDYQIEVHADEGVEFQDVDLVTTFNLIKGIHPKRYRELDNAGRRYVVIEGDDCGDSVLVVWRSVKDLDPQAERSYLGEAIAEALGAELADYDTIWHNADSAIPNAQSLDAEFKRLMFEPEPALS